MQKQKNIHLYIYTNINTSNFKQFLLIILNLAEGSGRLSGNDKKRFYAIALGSLKETQCLLLLLNEQGLLTQSNHLNAMLINLIKSPGLFNPD